MLSDSAGGHLADHQFRPPRCHDGGVCVLCTHALRRHHLHFPLPPHAARWIQQELTLHTLNWNKSITESINAGIFSLEANFFKVESIVSGTAYVKSAPDRPKSDIQKINGKKLYLKF